jgi:hypothetical protein
MDTAESRLSFRFSGIRTRPRDVPLWTKKRFAQVGPGTEEYQWSQMVKCLASSCRAGSEPGAK